MRREGLQREGPRTVPPEQAVAKAKSLVEALQTVNHTGFSPSTDRVAEEFREIAVKVVRLWEEKQINLSRDRR